MGLDFVPGAVSVTPVNPNPAPAGPPGELGPHDGRGAPAAERDANNDSEHDTTTTVAAAPTTSATRADETHRGSDGKHEGMTNPPSEDSVADNHSDGVDQSDDSSAHDALGPPTTVDKGGTDASKSGASRGGESSPTDNGSD